ncbi:hydroxyethylthiazole kinase [Heyndrickxia oleronia]|uniref:hydroxyethylthiazole kinase n=1 Tax=Heyndrickxia oleronia TaxID=38875 RepID=UPI00203C4D8B|nr:hydroxyethylthiazole kinase [Heyndrickxia oleronia]
MNNIKELFNRVKETKPLIHHITNTVTINDCANVTLAIGGSPVMATETNEMEEMIQLADALVINFGTIHEQVFESMIRAGRAANRKGIPVIFDPVGVGATSFRTSKSQILLDQVKMDIIRGNVSELHALIGGSSQTKGVDAGEVSVSPIEIANRAAEKYKCSIGISGKKDVISDGKRTFILQNGDEILTKITGTGCMSGSIIASFAAVSEDFLNATMVGMSVMSIAGQRAKQYLKLNEGLGTFKAKLIDEIDLMNAETFNLEVRIREY